MPKKTAYSRNAAQRNKARQKSFEIVRPTSGTSTLETVESSDETNNLAVSEPELEEQNEREEEVEEVKKSSPVAVAAIGSQGSEPPKNISSRLAARRKTAQKSQRAATQMISAENYSYVNKDLIYILILAVILFAAIIIMRFVPAIGG